MSRGKRLKLTSSTRALLDSDDNGADGAHDVDARTQLVQKGKVAVERAVDRLHAVIGAIPPVVVKIKRDITPNIAFGISVGLALVVIVMQKFVFTKPIQRQHGSVADLVKRGQLRSDRRGISKPLKYEDPFNNPLVKMCKSDSTAEICGKVYRLAPVTLTDEQKSSHQKRRSRAYNWKRPTIFLKEGDEMPSDVDPDTVRWIPSNHPFATTASDIDENLAQTNVYQKDGVPFRIRAEHEALQRKLEALQSEQKLSKVALTPNSLRSIERSSDSTLVGSETQESNFAEHQELSQNDMKYPDKTDSLGEPDEP